MINAKKDRAKKRDALSASSSLAIIYPFTDKFTQHFICIVRYFVYHTGQDKASFHLNPVRTPMGKMKNSLLKFGFFIIFGALSSKIAGANENPYASIFITKEKQLGPFRIKIDTGNDAESPRRKSFAFARIYSRLLWLLSIDKFKCSMVLDDDFYIEGFWVRKSREQKIMTRADCIAELTEALENYQPTIDEVNRAKSALLTRELPAPPPPRLSPEQAAALQSGLQELLPRRDDTSRYLTQKLLNPEALAEYMHEQKVIRSAMKNALARILPATWPDSPRLALTIKDYQNASPESFITWLRDRQERKAIRLISDTVGATFPNPKTYASNKKSDQTPRHIEVPSHLVSEKKIFLITFWKVLDEYPPNISKVGGFHFCADRAKKDQFNQVRTAKCVTVASYPGIAAIGIYIPTKQSESNSNELDQLKAIAETDELSMLRDEGSSYGFSSPIFVTIAPESIQ